MSVSAGCGLRRIVCNCDFTTTRMLLVFTDSHFTTNPRGVFYTFPFIYVHCNIQGRRHRLQLLHNITVYFHIQQPPAKQFQNFTSTQKPQNSSEMSFPFHLYSSLQRIQGFKTFIGFRRQNSQNSFSLNVCSLEMILMTSPHEVTWKSIYCWDRSALRSFKVDLRWRLTILDEGNKKVFRNIQIYTISTRFPLNCLLCWH